MTTVEARLDALEQNGGGGGGSGNADLEQRLEVAENDIQFLDEQYRHLDTDLSGRVEVNERDIDDLRNSQDSFVVGV